MQGKKDRKITLIKSDPAVGLTFRLTNNKIFKTFILKCKSTLNKKSVFVNFYIMPIR